MISDRNILNLVWEFYSIKWTILFAFKEILILLTVVHQHKITLDGWLLVKVLANSIRKYLYRQRKWRWQIWSNRIKLWVDHKTKAATSKICSLKSKTALKTLGKDNNTALWKVKILFTIYLYSEAWQNTAKTFSNSLVKFCNSVCKTKHTRTYIHSHSMLSLIVNIFITKFC